MAGAARDRPNPDPGITLKLPIDAPSARLTTVQTLITARILALTALGREYAQVAA